MFSKYYQSELTYLRELGKEFAAANPALAGLFAERGGDPDVERLLEGFAFLASRIRERIDDAVPEVIDAVSQLVVPQLAQPIPACSVVEFLPNYSALRGVHLIDRGTELGSNPIKGTQCKFRTTSPIHLLPLELKRTSLDQTSQNITKLILHFQRRGGTMLWPESGSVRLFLHGPLGLTSTIFLWLMRNLKNVVFMEGTREVRLPSARVHPLGLQPDFSLLPWPDYAPDGLRLIQEYFTLSPKLLFVELEGLNDVRSEEVGERFQLVLEFEKPPKLPERVDDDLLKLHCVPVINLFECSADPITRDVRVHEHLVRGGGLNPHHMEIYSVDSVIGLSSQRQTRRLYAPFYHFSHLEEDAADRAFFAVRRTPSPIDNAIDTYLSVTTPSDVEPDFSEEVFSIDLTCTNRALPTELKYGDICKPTPRSPTLAKFSNITEVTRPARPPIGSEAHWRLVSHLALNVNSLTNPRALRGLLHHYNLHIDSDHQRSRTNELRVNAIRSVTSQPERIVIDRVPMRGFHTHIEVDAEGFVSVGDAFIFGCTLDWLFITEVPLNSYHRLSMSVHPLGVEFEWPATTGTQPVF
jgi:type VI secretion system protein ImpG